MFSLVFSAGDPFLDVETQFPAVLQCGSVLEPSFSLSVWVWLRFPVRLKFPARLGFPARLQFFPCAASSPSRSALPSIAVRRSPLVAFSFRSVLSFQSKATVQSHRSSALRSSEVRRHPSTFFSVSFSSFAFQFQFVSFAPFVTLLFSCRLCLCPSLAHSSFEWFVNFFHSIRSVTYDFLF
jgi:hypothetical protein